MGSGRNVLLEPTKRNMFRRRGFWPLLLLVHGEWQPSLVNFWVISAFGMNPNLRPAGVLCHQQFFVLLLRGKSIAFHRKVSKKLRLLHGDSTIYSTMSLEVSLVVQIC